MTTLARQPACNLSAAAEQLPARIPHAQWVAGERQWTEPHRVVGWFRSEHSCWVRPVVADQRAGVPSPVPLVALKPGQAGERAAHMWKHLHGKMPIPG